MNIQTGLYVPGTAFNKSQIESVVASQRPAILKGAYHGAAGVKQRVIIVDNEEVKKEFKKLLLNHSTFRSGICRAREKCDSHTSVMAVHGKELALSERIITLAESKQEFIKLKKLYIETQTYGDGRPKYCTSIHKQPTFKVAAISGLAVGLLTAALSTNSLALVLGLGAFIGRGIHQELKPEIETIESNWQDLCHLFDKHDLHCKDIRLLNHRSGDRVYLKDITSSSDRIRARCDTSGPRAQDEQLAAFLRSSPQNGVYEKVSGYQGQRSYPEDGKHIIRRTPYHLEGCPETKYKYIRQTDARVTTEV